MKQIIIFMKRTYLKLFRTGKQRVQPAIMKQDPPKVTEKPEKTSPITEVLCQIENYLEKHYEFRYNLLRETTEYRPRHTSGFVLLEQRKMNSLCLDIRKSGIDCWDKDISRYLYSDKIREYHPFHAYMEQLPEWDGVNRVASLAKRVSDNAVWVNGFHRWMLGLAAQWMGVESLHANSVAPVLISRKQGKHKSTFCKLLLPDELQAYYTDSYDLNVQASAEQKLTAFGLINLDELDKFSDKKMTLLKNIMQMSSINIRKAYKKNFSSLPRVASFIATSNRTDLLTDPTGSRRFLCVEIEKKIDVSPIDYPQLYAQLKTELLSGERYWFSGEEEKEITTNNKTYQKQNAEEDVFHNHFRIPKAGEQGEWVSGTHILEVLRKQHPAVIQHSTSNRFGRVLLGLGLERIHTRTGSKYHIIPIGDTKTA